MPDQNFSAHDDDDRAHGDHHANDCGHDDHDCNVQNVCALTDPRFKLSRNFQDGQSFNTTGHVRKPPDFLKFFRYTVVMAELNTNDLKKIIQRRDPKYDGRFYFGVKTTKIYCRPVCPAKPKQENIVILKSCAEAENQGFRPCLRCHPDTMPGIKWHGGTIQSVARALRLIESSFDSEQSITHLAERVGLSDRHLRRLFEEHLGAPPIEILTTKRLHLAKQLVKETKKPLSEIAFAAGFQSVRRFNEAFKKRYRTTPTEHRSKLTGEPNSDQICLHLPIRGPYDWKNTLAYLQRHETFGLEKIANDQYSRFLNAQSSFTASYNSKRQQLDVTLIGVPLSEVRDLLPRIQNLFDLHHTPAHLPGRYANDGIRVPGSFDSFESAISIILSQLISTQAAKEKLKQLTLEFGILLGTSQGQPVYQFPKPEVLKHAPIEKVGTTKARAEAIRQLAHAVDSQEIDLSRSTDLLHTKKSLLKIKGIGPWTAEMIAMRCLGDSDAFPHNDLLVAKALASKLFSVDDWTSQRAYLTHLIWRTSTIKPEDTHEL